MTKPAAINKKKNVFHGVHKANKRRIMKGRAVELEETKSMTAAQRRKRLTNSNANVTFSKKKLRLLNKGKGLKDPKDVEMEDMSEGVLDVRVVPDRVNEEVAFRAGIRFGITVVCAAM